MYIGIFGKGENMVNGSIDDFTAWMNTQISWYPFASYDRYGSPVYGTATTLYVYLESIPRLVKNQLGQEVVSGKRFYSKTTVGVLDKLVMAGVEQPPILRVDRYYNDRSSQEYSVINV